MDTDTGHIKNLNADQISTLREFWIALVTSIQQNPNLLVPEVVQSGWFWNEATPNKSKKRGSLPGRSSISGRSSIKSTYPRPFIVRPRQIEEVVSAGAKEAAVEPSTQDFASLKWCKALEKFFLFAGFDNPDVIALRFLRARKWEVNLAVEMLLKCLMWRVKEGVDELLKIGEVGLEEELAVGKGYLHGKDNDGLVVLIMYRRPVCYIHVRLHDKNTADFEKTCKISILTFEYGRLLMPKGCESVALMFDMTAPWIFNGCWAIIKQWIDPTVVGKIQFISLQQVSQYIPKEYLPEILQEENAETSGAYRYEYQAPTLEEIQLLESFRQDSVMENDVWLDYQDAAMHFMETTLKWAYEEEVPEFERAERVKQLYTAYKKVVPYKRSKSHYHRLGLIADD